VAVIEIVTFRLQSDADEEDFLAEDRRIQTLAHLHPGILRRTTARGEDRSWAVITMWDSPAGADTFEHESAPADIVDASTLSIRRYATL
jgi:hypothetical protein